MFGRRFIGIFLVNLLVFIIFAYVNKTARLEGLLFQQLQVSQTLQATLSGHLNRLFNDLAFLMNSAPLQNYADQGGEGRRRTLERYFQVFAETSRRYDQIRVLSAQGYETVRINYVDSHGKIVTPAALQDKSQRYYFTDVLGLTAGETYISDLDLNVENNEVEQPHKPVIRLSKKIFNKQDEFVGVLVLNFLAEPLIDSLSTVKLGKGNRLALVGEDGFWIFDSLSKNSWSKQLGARERFKEKYGEAWPNLQKDNNGQFSQDGYVFTFDRVAYPHLNKEQKQRYLLLVNVFDKQAYILGEFDREYLVAIILYVFGVGAIAWFWARLSYQKRVVETMDQERLLAVQATKTKSEFLANMSHELRTPMNAVLGLAYLLDNEEHSAVVREIARKILRAGRSLQSILNDILDFSKIEAGKIVLENKPFGLNDVLNNVSTIMSAYAHDKNLELIIKADTSYKTVLKGDCLRLEQVLINLLGNAIKFTLKGHVALYVETQKADDKEIVLTFRVEDSGIGMDKETVSKIFQPFEQGDVSASKRFEGTGLGLTICRRLLSMMQAQLDVTSQPGVGSVFSFTLSFEKGTSTEDIFMEISKLNVLIADDHDIALEALRQSATALDWQVTCVKGGADALEALKKPKESRDLLILDWKMPDIDGLSVAREIKQNYKGKNSPIVIMVTAHSRHDLLSSPDAGYIDAVLEKPVTASMLYNVAANLLGKACKGDMLHYLGTKKPLEGVRILVVDDNEFNRDVAERVFAAEGAVVSSAQNGENALDWLNQNFQNVDLILMDIQMPIMDGYETTRVIRRHEKFKNLKVIALTAGVFETQRQAAFNAGMDGFIAKPFDVPSAVETILNTLQGVHLNRVFAQDDQMQTIPSQERLIDLDHALTLWGDKKTYYKYLKKFLENYRDVDREFSKLDNVEKGRLAHKLVGASSSLSLNKLAKTARNLESTDQKGGDVSKALNILCEVLEDTVQAIDVLLSDSSEFESTEQVVADPERREGAVISLYHALDTDNPNEIRPALDDLSNYIPSSDLATIEVAVDDYDFEEAKNHVRLLATRLEIKREMLK
jgi:signal transduction histidine kinase/DNA-binding response OmpR family regulator